MCVFVSLMIAAAKKKKLFAQSTELHVLIKTTTTNSNLLSQTTNSVVCFYIILTFFSLLFICLFVSHTTSCLFSRTLSDPLIHSFIRSACMFLCVLANVSVCISFVKNSCSDRGTLEHSFRFEIRCCPLINTPSHKTEHK